MTVDRAIVLLKMMASPIRLKILKILAEKGCGVCVSGMGDYLKIPQPSISQHLAHLRNSGILKCEKKGKNVCYEIAEESIKKMLLSLDLDDLDKICPEMEIGE